MEKMGNFSGIRKDYEKAGRESADCLREGMCFAFVSLSKALHSEALFNLGVLQAFLRKIGNRSLSQSFDSNEWRWVPLNAIERFILQIVFY